MTDDAELLRRYAEEKSEPAFAELVRRHLPLVYSCALRRVGGDSQLAEDVAQQVFAEVARRAMALASRPVLAGWLFTSTRFAASKAIRTRQRRLEREQEAYIMQEPGRNLNPAVDWDKTRPVLDDVIDELNERDRAAILLRFFEHRDFASIGARLNFTDNAARMRVERALEKLRTRLAHRGITSTAAAVATVLAEQTATALPAGLATNVTSAALGAGGIASGVAAGLGTPGAIALMSVGKLQIGIAGALIVASGTGLLLQTQHIQEMRAELAVLQRQSEEVASLQLENQRFKNIAAEIASLQQDEVTLARLRDEAAALKATLRSAETNAAQSAAATSARPRPAISATTTGALRNLKPLSEAKDWSGMMGLIDNLIPKLDPTSYDMAYVLDLKAKIYLLMDQYSKAIESWEKALQLSEQIGYFDVRESRSIARNVAKLRYAAGLTTKLPPDQWF